VAAEAIVFRGWVVDPDGWPFAGTPGRLVVEG
jgi:hypothetical protein